MRLLFVYKHNPQDPSEKCLRRWLPHLVGCFREFCFKKMERQRFDQANMVFSQRLREAIQTYRPTHILSWVPYMNPEEIFWCKQQGIRHIAAINGFASFSTGLYRDQALYIESLSQLDSYLIPHRPHLDRLKNLSVRAVEMPFFYDPKVFFPVPDFFRKKYENRSDLFFCGNIGSFTNQGDQGRYRINMISELSKFFLLKVMSDYKKLPKTVKLVRETKLDTLINWSANNSKAALCLDYFPNISIYRSLNENLLDSYENEYKFAIRPRTVNMLGAGLPVFVERHVEMQRFFDDRTDVIMWNDLHELKTLLAYFLKKNSELQEIAQVGHKKVKEFHTVERRWFDIILPALLN